MKKKKFCALVCALLALCTFAFAEEWRIGDLVYVPEGKRPDNLGMIELRVEGLSYDTQKGETTVVPSLAGAEFGIYVYSDTGELVPWADPLSPTQPMRIRTESDGVRFVLPYGLDFFLRQENAPDGYAFDAQALIPIDVSDDEIIVHNAMAGRLEIYVTDELGAPLSNITVVVSGADASAFIGTTDTNGMAAFEIRQPGIYTVAEGSLPEGIFPPQSAFVEGQTVPADTVSAQVNSAQLTRIDFVHPVAGSVVLTAEFCTIDDNGETVSKPLAGVRMDIQDGQSIVTDAEGRAQAWLLEGEYSFRNVYEGELDAVLSDKEGNFTVHKSETTQIEITAIQSTGRVLVQAESVRETVGGSVSFVKRDTGEIFGPYAFDGNGRAISDALGEGTYGIETLEAPQETELGLFTLGEQIGWDPQELTISVQPGVLTEIGMELRTWESQDYALLVTDLDDTGKQIYGGIAESLTLDVLDENGNKVGEVTTQGGMVSLSLLSGTYTLRMSEDDASRLGVNGTSRAVELPSTSAAVYFPGNSARLILQSVDENGTLLCDAQYSVTDGADVMSFVWTDANGEAVTEPLVPGEIKVVCLTPPAGHDVAQTVQLHAEAGEAPVVQMAHPTYGTVDVRVSLRSLDTAGQQVTGAVDSAVVRVSRVQEGVAEPQTYICDGDGSARIQLPAGEYVAQTDSVSGTLTVHFEIENGQNTQVELVCTDGLGGVRAQLVGKNLNDELLAQVDFELISTDGQVFVLNSMDGTFYAGGLRAGEYVLHETHAPEGYSPVTDRQVCVSGSEVSIVDVPLEEYAVLTVRKTGLVFNDRLQSFIVPMTGEYAVYTEIDGELHPYPSAENPTILWAGVTQEQIASGCIDRIKLPATMEGTTYYLCEQNPNADFTGEEVYEVTLIAGQDTELNCTVSSSLGFFELDLMNENGDHVAGSVFDLVDSNGETVLTFETEAKAYRSEKPVPAGTYHLKQVQPAKGCTMAEESDREIVIEPYLTQGGAVTLIAMACLRIPSPDEPLDLLSDLYAIRQQDVTMLFVDARRLDIGKTFRVPQMTIRIDTEQRMDVISVVLSGTGDGLGGTYRARVEYCLTEGGWQPSDARMTDTLNMPAAVSLSDIKEDICAVRITYLDAETGMEVITNAFTPGQVAVGVRLGAEQSAQLHAEASFTGLFIYVDEPNGPLKSIELAQQMQFDFEAEGDGTFETVSGGRDGRISGSVFSDLDQDGVMTARESAEYLAAPYEVSVSLLDAYGDVIDICEVDENGRYVFDGLAYGTYAVAFDAGPDVVFSHGEGYSEHIVSGVQDGRSGMSNAIVIDGEHTDCIVHAGCVHAAQIEGTIYERNASDMIGGFDGLRVELRTLETEEDEEPIVTITDEMGEFSFDGLMPGHYEMILELPEGYLCAGVPDGRIVKEFELNQGDKAIFDVASPVQPAASIGGVVSIDGIDAEHTASLMTGVKVILLRTQDDGSVEQFATEKPDAAGFYTFDGLYEGEYSVLFQIEDKGIFTRCGENTFDFGIATNTGVSQNFALGIGEALEGIDACIALPAELTVSVFQDPQMDGAFEGNEQMLAGVRITLIRLEDGQPAGEENLMTDEDGNAVFEGILAGEYKIRYLMPGSWRTTMPAKTGNQPVSCVPQSTLNMGESEPFALEMEAEKRLYIGAVLSGTVSGMVYYDDNANAVKEEDETSAPQTLIELLSDSGEVLAQTSPDSQGRYAFEGLMAGRYRVRFTAEENSVFSATERTMEQGGVQKSEGPVSTTRLIAVRMGESTDAANAGVVRLSSISGKIWEDENANHMQEENERGLSNVTVALMDGAGRVTQRSTKTEEHGEFTIEGLMPNDYVLRVEAPEGYEFSGATANTALSLTEYRDGRGYSSAFTLSGGMQISQLGYGLYRPGTVAGRLWNDVNYDGLIDAAESGLSNVSVTLIDASETEIATEQTSRDGSFEFKRVAPGSYSVHVTLPEGYAYTAADRDSRAPRQNEREATVFAGMLAMGGSVDGVNIGALSPAAIGGKVFVDADDNGYRQSDEAGLEGLRVTLDVIDGSDTGRQLTTSTDANGAYRFSGVMPGEVRLIFELPDGMVFSKQAASGGSIVPQADARVAQSASIAVTADTELTDLDAGAVYVGVLSGSVWNDADYDGMHGAEENGVAGARILLLDAQNSAALKETVTDSAGNYAFDCVRMGTYRIHVELPDGMIFTCGGRSIISDMNGFVAQSQAFNVAMGESQSGVDVGAIVPGQLTGRVAVDWNADGIADESESGLAGAVVTLMQAENIVATATTQADGHYAFEALRPGAYRMRIALPEDTLFVEGSPLSLAHRDAKEGETMTVKLGTGQTIEMYAAATVKTGAIGGRMWNDTDVSGTMDDGEPALANQRIELISFAGGAETIVATAQTNQDGRYLFTGLRAGNYALRFTLPEDMLFTDTTGEAGASCVPVGRENGGRTEAFPLAMGETLSQMNAGGILPGTIGDTVWMDTNRNGLQDYKEPLVPGIWVTLFRVTGDEGNEIYEQVAQTVSDEYGYYRFEALRPGRYAVRVEGENALTSHVGEPLGEIDSDVDPQTRVSGVFLLRSGQALRNVDIGLTDGM